MATLILNNNSIGVRLESDHVEICRHAPAENEPERTTLPLRSIDRVLVVGSPAITMPVFMKFLDRGIPCVFLTKGGRLRGALGSPLDLMEPFRPAFADLLVLNLLNHNRFQPERHFQRDEETDGWYLNNMGRKIFFMACEESLSRPFVPRGETVRMTFRQAIERQVVEVVRSLEDGTSPSFFRLA